MGILVPVLHTFVFDLSGGRCSRLDVSNGDLTSHKKSGTNLTRTDPFG